MDETLTIVTGASRGLGLHVSKTLLLRKHNVAGISRSGSEVMFADGRPASRIENLDLSRPETIHKWVRNFLNENGIPRNVVLNAAIGFGKPLSIMHERDISVVLKTNLESNLLLIKYLSRRMLLNGGGTFVFVSSITAKEGFKNLSVYSATKAGMEASFRSLAREFSSRNIRFVSLSPGFMETDMTSGYGASEMEKIRRRTLNGEFVRPEHVAEVVGFVLSDESVGLNGAVIGIDNGQPQRKMMGPN